MMTTTKNDTAFALEWLSKEPLLHVDMAQVLARGIGHIVDAGPQGILVRLTDEEGPTYLMSADTREEARRLMLQAKDADQFVLHQEAWLDETLETLGMRVMMPCHQCAYFGSTPLPASIEGVSFAPLGPEWTAFIAGIYKNPVGTDYLTQQLERGVMFGAFDESKPDIPRQDAIMGFVGEHGEGSLGILEVLPAYRRRGIGRALEAVAANRQLEKGWVPFTQVTVGNTASVRLQRSLGFRVSRKIVYWLEKA